MKFGLEENIVSKIAGVLASYAQVDEAIVYGSRVKGNYKYRSDIDIALKGSGIDLVVLNKITLDLDDLLLPWKIDLSVLGRLNNAALLDHINSAGVKIYQKV